MILLSNRQFDDLYEELATNLSVDFFEDDEIDHTVREIRSYEFPVREKVLALALALSHASSSLVPGLLRNVRSAASILGVRDMTRWLGRAFDLRDSDGLDQALAFLSRVTVADLDIFRGRGGLLLHEATPLLVTFLRAMSGREFRILPDRETYTDTEHIYLPQGMNRFASREQNLALYKLAAASCWTQLALGTLMPEVDPDRVAGRFRIQPGTELDAFFAGFRESRLALDLYTIIESFRIEFFLLKELPGLMKQAGAIKEALYQDRQRLGALPARSAFVEGLWQYYLAGKIKGERDPALTAAAASLYEIQSEYKTGSRASVSLLFDLYDTATRRAGCYSPRPAPPVVARIRPPETSRRLRQARAGKEKQPQAVISRILTMPELMTTGRGPGKMHPQDSGQPAPQEYVMIRGKLVPLRNDQDFSREEQGGTPGGTLLTGSGAGGRGLELADRSAGQATGSDQGGILYDEWDFRRNGYKKGWCSLYEREIEPGEQPFVELTLKRYGSALSLLRKKFELLKRERRVRRRLRDGDSFDIDAVVETFSDMRAGVSPSENLYTRIERQERNIAVLFLLDTSGSTRGWVNQAEKESLVLMSEALATLGDRHAVYAFSSLTRNRCDCYRVKGFDEPYSEAVKKRIAGIEPLDYTRIGPFVRHAASLLAKVDARTKLLIFLSDGRPEDWDDYKGAYAIEDTRKSLIEASMQGIHPFCITIDREARSYLPHLFGEVNYIVIDDVRKLPGRMTELYCRLTA